MTENTAIQNSALCMAVEKHFPDGQWKFVQNQDEESLLTDELIPLTDEEQAEMDELHAMLKEADALYTYMCDAVRYGNLADVRYLVETQGVDMNAECYCGWTLLHCAARSNPNVAIFEYLVSAGANVNDGDSQGWTPLHFAANDNPNVAVLQYLISQGVDVNAQDNEGKTPLDRAYQEEKKRILREAMDRQTN